MRVQHCGACVCECVCAFSLIHSVRCRSTAEWLRGGASGAQRVWSCAPTHLVFILPPELCSQFPPSVRIRGCGRAFGGALGSVYLCEGVSLRRVGFTAFPVALPHSPVALQPTSLSDGLTAITSPFTVRFFIGLERVIRLCFLHWCAAI